MEIISSLSMISREHADIAADMTGDIVNASGKDHQRH